MASGGMSIILMQMCLVNQKKAGTISETRDFSLAGGSSSGEFWDR
jgi:hypothetical protein